MNYHHHPQYPSLNDQRQSSSNSGKNCPQITLIIISLFLLLTAIILSVIAVLDPSWQVVDIREFQAEHHHGLYTDCTRAERMNRRNGHESYAERSPLHCTYKFDEKAAMNLEAQVREVDSNAAAAEAEHHQFHGWQKAVLVLIGLSLVSGGLALLAGLCTPCSLSWAILHCIFCFFALLFAISAASVFFFAAHRVDSRFVQGLVGTYEQQIGEAFYCYLVNCILLMLVFILSIIGAYHSARTSRSERTITREQLAPLYAPRVSENGFWKTSV